MLVKCYFHNDKLYKIIFKDHCSDTSICSLVTFIYKLLDLVFYFDKNILLSFDQKRIIFIIEILNNHIKYISILNLIMFFFVNLKNKCNKTDIWIQKYYEKKK